MNAPPVPTPAPHAALASTPKLPWRRIRWIVRALVAAIILVMLLRGCDGAFYYPSRTSWFSPQEFGISQFEDVYFRTRDGVKLHGWWAPAFREPRGTVIHFHGNAENVTNHIALSAWLPGAGYNLLIFDYRGYGRSEGSVTRAGTVLDGHAALDYALSRPEVDPRRLFFFGQSLGGAVAFYVAAERSEVRALVIDSSFPSYRAIATAHARRMLPFHWLSDGAANLLVSDGYDPVDVVDRIPPRPLLVIASGRDNVCFPELARALFDAAREPKQFWHVDDAGHCETVLLCPDEATRRIRALFDSAAGAP